MTIDGDRAGALADDMRMQQAEARRKVIDAINELATIAAILKPLDARREVLREPPKPAQSVVLPPGVGATTFDLGRAAEVLQLGTILGDLDAVRSAAEARDARLVLATFCWLVRPGLELDGLFGRNAFIQLNSAY